MKSLKRLTYGASPMSGPVLEKLRSLFPDLELSQGYGMTEASAVLTFLNADDHRRGGEILKSAGRAVPGVVLSIRDEEGNEVPCGEAGEVWARAGNLMREYWNRPDATQDAFQDGWYQFRAEPLPLSGALKVLKRDLRKPYPEGQDRSVG